MTDKAETRRVEQLARLGRLLGSYGSRPERWPAAARGDLQTLIAEQPDARALVDDARALDRALSAAAEPVVAIDRALADRIAAAAFAVAPAANEMSGDGTPSRPPSAEVVALPRRVVTARPTVAYERVGRGRMAAALVAACLLGGIMLGGSIRVDHVLQDIADAIGLAAEFETTTTALSEESSEEEAL